MHYQTLPHHHAVLIVNEDRKTLAKRLWESLRTESPAHRFFDHTVIDTELAHEIIAFAQSPYTDPKIILISCNSIGTVAQNSLLKALEEPYPNVRFILVTSNKDTFLPTVLSRLHEHKHSKEETIPYSKEALLFLQTKPTERAELSMVTKLLASTDEEKRKDREKVKAFILALVEIMRTHNYQQIHILETIEIASFAGDPSSSGKTLVEYLGLLLPQLKV